MAKWKRLIGSETAVLSGLFFASGAAALVYEVVWFSLLRLVIGGSAISLGFLLAGYMGGLCLGSLAYARFAPKRGRPLRHYALMELGIGAFGLLIPVVLPVLSSFYIESAAHGPGNLILRAALGAVILVPPTVLMGATLPAAAKHLNSQPGRMAKVGCLYGANIFGAVLGCLATGFLLLRYGDIWTASLVAACLNGIVGLAAWIWAGKSNVIQTPSIQDEKDVDSADAVKWIYAVACLSGVTALGAQVVWTRLLSLTFGATVYAFSVILAVFLIGLGLGSGLGSWIGRRSRSPAGWLFLTQLSLALTVPLGFYLITHQIPFWNPVLSGWRALTLGGPFEMAFKCLNDLYRAGAAMGLATLAWGASFPLALAAGGGPRSEAGAFVGRLYAVNTIGAILGALVFSLALIPSLGTQGCHYVLAGLAGISALIIPVACELSRRKHPAHVDATKSAPVAGSTPAWGVSAVAALLIGVFAVHRIGPTPTEFIAFGWQYKENRSVEELFVAEGMNSSVAVTQPGPNRRLLHVGGKTVASDAFADKRVQRLLGHLPALLHPNPKSALIVGMGTGMTAGSFVAYPEIENITICEIERLVPEAAGRFFKKDNSAVLEDPRTKLIIDDARHFLSVTEERFDIITSDPIHPWMHGAAALYSEEYYETVKSRLNPGGKVTQWVPLYYNNLKALKCVLATFYKAFPEATFWYTYYGDLVMLGQLDPPRLDAGSLQERMDSNALAGEALHETAIDDALDLLKTYWSRGRDLEPFLQGAEINRDRSLRLEYLAGWSLLHSNMGWIWRNLQPFRTYPEDLIVASEDQAQALRDFMKNN